MPVIANILLSLFEVLVWSALLAALGIVLMIVLQPVLVSARRRWAAMREDWDRRRQVNEFLRDVERRRREASRTRAEQHHPFA